MIRYRSTRGSAVVDLPAALEQGIAPDGGLYIPESLPEFDVSDFQDANTEVEIAERFLAPFFSGTSLAGHLSSICTQTYAFPISCTQLPPTARGQRTLLELFHGPTAAFKDVGAGFLASSMAVLRDGDPDKRPVLILVATSGDTGGAVAAAFHRRPGFEVAVLYPTGRVSERQEQQLTCWGENVTAFSVKGTFDDCQRLVKAAFADADLSVRYRLSSANSINIGRLLPQAVYYAAASLRHWRANQKKLSFVIPTGNLGNGLAAVMARACGLPIGDIVFATNANTAIPDYLRSGQVEDRDSVDTLASAMDVGRPSNLERLRNLFGEAQALNKLLSAYSVSDEGIRTTIGDVFRRDGIAICPHTATAFHVYDLLPEGLRDEQDWALVATAHPAKFERIVESVTGAGIEMPRTLADLMDKPASAVSIEPSLAELSSGLERR